MNNSARSGIKSALEVGPLHSLVKTRTKLSSHFKIWVSSIITILASQAKYIWKDRTIFIRHEQTSLTVETQ